MSKLQNNTCVVVLDRLVVDIFPTNEMSHSIILQKNEKIKYPFSEIQSDWVCEAQELLNKLKSSKLDTTHVTDSMMVDDSFHDIINS